MGTSAHRAALGGEPVTAEEALGLGWIDAQVHSDELLDVALARALMLGSYSPTAYADTKQQLRRPARDAIAGSANEERVSQAWRSDETRTRIATFLERLRR